MSRISRVAGTWGGRGAALLAAGLVAGCLATPANPGPFTGTAQPGSYIALVDEAGATIPASYVDFGRPACADGRDNDADAVADLGDTGCVDADDANERLPGLQAYVPSTLPMTVNPSGVIVVEPTDLVVQQREYCFDAGTGTPWCTGITLRGSGPTRRGTIETDSTLTLPVPITIAMEAVSGFPSGFGDDCVIPHIESVLVGSYDEQTGTAELHMSGVPVEQAPDCGTWTASVNAALGLPTTGGSTLVVTLLDPAGEPLQLAE
jgi:hypothetical protein